MDQLSETNTPIKRRRYSAAFKAQVLEEIEQPGISVAAVARRHGLNANLIHNWRKSPTRSSQLPAIRPSFVEVEAATPQGGSSGHIVLELPYQSTTIKIHWPVCHATALATWLKAIVE